ncbi:flagellar biosynthetic protein FliO [Agarivorans sp.]|uniref:flagellar biosynthetic protein FliO n=1 Tax=Agarivorans sp. TaxID=1872412 RepID=UPI003D020BEA
MLYRLILSLFAGTVLPAAAEPAATASPPSTPIEIVSWLMSLALVLVTIFVCAWILKKTRLNQFSAGQAKVVSNLTLGARERVTVVEIGGQQYLLGITQHSINLLDKLETPLPVPAGSKMNAPFAKQLQGMLFKNEK